MSDSSASDPQPAWDGSTGTAGGVAFAAGLNSVAQEREFTVEALAAASAIDAQTLLAAAAGRGRLTLPALARLARSLRLRPIEFMQRLGLLSLDVYALGLDPLFFLPEGPIRYDARIYMREINPRHAVPEGDMTKRNPTLRALSQDPVLDELGKLEVELTYLLRAAVQDTGGTL